MKSGFLSSGFFSFFSRIFDLLLLNILFLLGCLPIVTVGVSCSALYYVTLRMVRQQEGSSIVRDFFCAYRQNLKQGIVLWLIVLLVLFVAVADIFVMGQLLEYDFFFQCMFGLLCLVSAVFLMASLYLFPLLAQFHNTVKGYIRSAISLSLRHFPYTLMFLLLTALPVLAAFLLPHALEWELFLFLLIGFSLYAYLFSWFFTVIFKGYIEQTPVDDGKTQ